VVWRIEPSPLVRRFTELGVSPSLSMLGKQICSLSLYSTGPVELALKTTAASLHDGFSYLTGLRFCRQQTDKGIR
jgi:hypothetical protein